MTKSEKNLKDRLKYRKTGIYTVTNLIDGKMYVGYATNFTDRKSQHFKALEKGKHRNSYLQNAYNKYGKDNFKFEILEQCQDKFLTALEHYWCNLLNTHNKDFGYNILPTNPNTGVGIGLKRPRSESMKKKLKDNYKFTPALEKACRESIKKAQAAVRGTKRTREQIIKNRTSRFGKRIIEIYNLDGSFFNSCDIVSDAIK